MWHFTCISAASLWPQDRGLFSVEIWKTNELSRASTSLRWLMYIIYSFIIACHAHIHNSCLLYFQIFHISWFGVIIHFPTTPVQYGFVVFVWIFNVWRWKAHGFSTLNVVIQRIGERGKLQNSISADLFCFCLWVDFSAELRTSHSSNSYNYICEFIASEV